MTDRIEPGHVFTTFHFPETRTNLLVGQSADVNTSCPEYKVIAVDVKSTTPRANLKARAAASMTPEEQHTEAMLALSGTRA